MRLRVLDLPLADDGQTNRYALVVDQVQLSTLTDDENAQIHAFGASIGASGVLISSRGIDVESMTPLFEIRSEPGLLATVRDAILRHLPPAAGKRLV